MADRPIYEGVFAINKPPSLTSAQVIRDVQVAFKDSNTFQPWLEREQERKDAESHNQKKKRRSWKARQPLQVKIGHGGTLDPLATGVLILGVGSGTKRLGDFLGCKKSYETVVLFGATTDSYDSVGRVVERKPYQHITRDAVEAALGKFRGKIMQRPPVYSALRVQGKRLYEYAREGKEVPVEIQEREIEVEKLEMVEWLEGGKHEWKWPIEEASDEVKIGGRKDAGTKRLKLDPSGGVEVGSAETTVDKKEMESSEDAKSDEAEGPAEEPRLSASKDGEEEQPLPPSVRLRMTVTSGFYVRSLAHDLGLAVGSAGLMASLVRTRQGDFELEKALDYDDLEKGEEIWGPKVQAMLGESR